MRFASTRSFKLWQYTPSHSNVLIRSNKNYDESVILPENFTIDIEFSDVTYLDIPTFIGEISLREIVNIPEKIKEHLVRGNKAFEIVCNERNYYIIAGRCLVGKSNMDYDTTIYSNPGSTYSEIMFDSNS